MNFEFRETTNEELAEQRMLEARRLYETINAKQRQLNHLKRKYNDLADSINELTNEYNLEKMGV